jgi:methyltransferase (TIGR00027 family)
MAPSHLFDAADTAIAIATIRAQEGLLPAGKRLFSDPYAALFCARDPAPEATERLLRVPYLREMVRLRTRFIDDTVQLAIDDGIRQLVILGVGFDCRALRMPAVAASGMHVFEVDVAIQLERRQHVFADAGIATPAWEHPIACDFSAADFEATLAADLAAQGFRRGSGALFVWEGVIAYLDDPAVDRTLRFMARTGGAKTRLVFNYETFRVETASIVERAVDAGFSSLSTVGCAELHRRWLGEEPPESSELFRVALGWT